MRYRDRIDAGGHLAARLGQYAHRSDVAVVAVSASGLPVAHEVARRLHVPLAWLPVAVIEVPGRPGLTMGALVHDGLAVLDERIIENLEIPRSTVQ